MANLFAVSVFTSAVSFCISLLFIYLLIFKYRYMYEGKQSDEKLLSDEMFIPRVCHL